MPDEIDSGIEAQAKQLEILIRSVEKATRIPSNINPDDDLESKVNQGINYLINNSPEIEGRPLFEYLKETCPDLKYYGQEPMQWANDKLNEIPNGDIDTNAIRLASNLMAAGAKENSEGIMLSIAIQYGAKIANVPAIEYAQKNPDLTIDGISVADWVNQNYYKNFHNSTVEPDLELACNLLAAGATSSQVYTKGLLEKIIQKNMQIGDQDPGAWAVDHGFGSFALRTEALDKFLREEQTAVKSSFISAGSKTSGVSKGGLLKTTDKSSTYVEKPAAKDTSGYDRTPNSLGEKAITENRDVNAEYILGPIFNKLLPQQSPKIRLVVSDQELKGVTIADKTISNIKVLKGDAIHSPEVSITSRFFEKFQDLKKFKLTNSGSLNQVRGFEKIIAGCLILGEPDFHSENVGVVNRGTDIQPDYLAVKIDQGRAGLRVFTQESVLRDSLKNDFNKFRYNDMPFHADKLKAAIDEMVKVSEAELKDIMAKRIANLEAAGFKVDSEVFLNRVKDYIDYNDDKKSVEDTYLARIMQNIATARELSKTLDIIMKTDAPDAVKEGGWLQSIGNKDPIAWAVKEGYKIEGQSPVEWAIANNRLIEEKSPLDWERDEVLNEELLKATIDYKKVKSLMDLGAVPNEAGIDVIITKINGIKQEITQNEANKGGVSSAVRTPSIESEENLFWSKLKIGGLTPENYKDSFLLSKMIDEVAHHDKDKLEELNAGNDVVIDSEDFKKIFGVGGVLTRSMLKAIHLPSEAQNIEAFMDSVSHNLGVGKEGSYVIRMNSTQKDILEKALTTLEDTSQRAPGARVH